MDFNVTSNLSFKILTPITKQAINWSEEYLEQGETTHIGNGIAIEHRYFDDIYDGIIEEGMEIYSHGGLLVKVEN